MDKVITATGLEFDCSFVTTITSPARAYIRVKNTPLARVAEVFNDPKETAKIIYGEYILENYSRLVSLGVEGDTIKISLASD